MVEFRSLLINEVEDLLEEYNEKRFRGKQIFSWMHKGMEDFNSMSNLPAVLREKLNDIGYIKNMEVITVLKSKIDGTCKYLMALNDNNVIECVLMKYSFGNTICISTQVGCRMGCSFCASTIGGRIRDLTPGEMVGQILKVQRESGEKINNVVLMGTGEPFDNFDNVIKFLKIINCKDGLNIGMRHITISTCGLVPEIKKFSDMDLQVTLAISLHAADDELRKKIMPIAHKYSLKELYEVCRYYIAKTNKRITFEYALIKGINDSDGDAVKLANYLSNLLCHVNLIPVNSVEGNSYIKTDKNNVEKFKEILMKNNIQVTVRRELGSDINAACGQLRRNYLSNIDGFKR